MRSLVQGYEELRLRIDRRNGGPYHVFASTSSAEASASFELPFNELEIENFILRVSRPRGRRRVDTSAIGDARRFGGGLFKALFRDEIHGVYRDALASVRATETARITAVAGKRKRAKLALVGRQAAPAIPVRSVAANQSQRRGR